MNHEHDEHGHCCGREHEHEHEHTHHDHDCCCGHAHHEHHDHDCCGHAHEHHHEHEHGHNHGCSCGCGHDHGGEERTTRDYVLMALSAAALIIAMLFLDGTAELIVCLISYLLVGFPVLKESFENILHGEIFDENFLMSVASIGAFCIGDYPEAAAVMLLYSVGEMLQDKAVDSSRKSIQALVSIRPDQANLVDGGDVHAVQAETVPVGAVILVRPGERVPLDGEVIEGSSAVDTSALTGESMPRQWNAGDDALAGCVVQEGLLKIRVTKPFGESSVSRILNMVEEAGENKAQPEKFITRFARIYTPIVCAAAVVVAIVPPLLGLGSWGTFIHKALSFLVISCPCALVISVPLSFFSGIGCASHNGILMKGSSFLELLAKAEVAAFDKTGTLTEGSFRISEIRPADGVRAEEVLEVAAYCESQSTHPLARAILAAYGKTPDAARIGQIKELSGHGLQVELDGKTALAGKRALLGDAAPAEDSRPGQTSVYVSLDGRYLGCIGLADHVKSDAGNALTQLRQLGLHDLTMLSGDHQTTADAIVQEIGLDCAKGELLPEDKVTQLEQLRSKGITLYAGDGINDAPVLAAADVGIAMGGLGSDAAMEAADVVIMTDEPSKIPQAIRIARKTLTIAQENIVFAIAVKVIILLLSLLMDIGLWLAVFADVGVCMLAIANSLRAMRAK